MRTTSDNTVSHPASGHADRTAIVAVAFVLLIAFAVQAHADEKVLVFSADRTESVFAEGRERIVLRGAARVESDDFMITADEIEIYGQAQRYVRSRGGVTVVDHKNDLFLTSEEFYLDRDANFLRANGNAYMEDRANEIVVKGATIQNWDDLDLTEISVNVRILGKDYTTRSQFARYRRGSETLELSGTPEVFWKGDEYRATRISIDLANDEIEFVGAVRAVVRQTDATAPDTGTTPTDATTPDATAPTDAVPGDSSTGTPAQPPVKETPTKEPTANE